MTGWALRIKGYGLSIRIRIDMSITGITTPPVEFLGDIDFKDNSYTLIIGFEVVKLPIVVALA